MARSSRHPNVVVFFTDQQRWDTVGVHGNPMGLTPNFDRMALEGTHLFNAFTCQPVCMPARACVQTGMFATQVQCHTNGCALPHRARTLAHYYNAAGYHTGYIGKWHLSREQIVPPADRGGYREWLGANILEWCSDAYNCTMYDDEGNPVHLPGYRVDALADAAIRFIDKHRSRPFFLFTAFLEPHFQNQRDDYPPPDVYADKFLDPWTPPDLRALGGSSARHLPGYYGMVKRLDDALGRIRDALKSLGLQDNTIVLFTADHGCHFKTRNGEYKRSCHDSSLRVPAALTGPCFVQGGRVTELFSLVDVAPTLLDACGLRVPQHMVGNSIVPIVQHRRTRWPEEVFAQISEAQVARAVRTRRWKYCVSAPDKHPSRDVGSDSYVEEALYDLAADPYELNNLIGYVSHRGVANVLQRRLLRCMARAGEARPTIVRAPEVRSGQKQVMPGEERL